MAHLHPVPAVGAIIMHDEKILLICRKNPPGAGLWSIPGGSVELGETLQEATAREVREETGLQVAVGEMAELSELIEKQDDSVNFHYIIIDYFARVVSGTLTPGSDVSAARWFDRSELATLSITPTLRPLLRRLGLYQDDAL